MDALGDGFVLWAELTRDEFVVVEFFVRKVEVGLRSVLGPAGLVVRAARRAGPGSRWDDGAAVRTNFWRHTPTLRLLHAGVFLVRFEIDSHQNVIVGNGLHVLHVIFQPHEVAETEQSEHFDGSFLFANKFRFDFVQAEVARETHNFRNKRPGEAAAAEFRTDEDADPADMSFPSAQLLVQRGIAHNFAINQRQQRQVLAEVDILAPLIDHLRIGDAMLDEHAFGFRNALEKFIKRFLVLLAQGSQAAFRAIFELDLLRIFLEFEFERHIGVGKFAATLPEAPDGGKRQEDAATFVLDRC